MTVTENPPEKEKGERVNLWVSEKNKQLLYKIAEYRGIDKSRIDKLSGTVIWEILEWYERVLRVRYRLIRRCLDDLDALCPSEEELQSVGRK